MEKKFNDKKSRNSRLGKRGDSEKSFDKKGTFDKDKPFRKKSGIRITQDKNFGQDAFAEKKSFRKPSFKKPYKKPDNGLTEGSNDHYYGKPFENKDKPYKKRERNFGGDEKKPFEKREGRFNKGGSFTKSEGGYEKKPYQKREGSFKADEKKPFEKREGRFNKGGSFTKSEGGYEKKPYQKREGSFKADEKKPFEKREGRFNKGGSFTKSEGGYEKKPYQKREGSFNADEKKPFEKRERSFDDKKPSKKKEDDFTLGFEDFSYGDEPKKITKFSREGKVSAQKVQRNVRKPSDDKKDDVVKEFKNRKEKSANTNIRTPDYDFKKFKNIEAEQKEKDKLRARRQKKDKSESPEDGKEDSEGGIRLNRFIANAGVCSRREADVLIQNGRVKINGEVMTEMGYRVQQNDSVYLDDDPLKKERVVYVLLNKPKDHITTTDDPEGRKTVMNLVKKACNERIYPVGRLDRNTTGLLLLTNDGGLAEKLAHPSNNIKKVYQILLGKPITEEDFAKISEGMVLEDGEIKVDKVSVISDDATALEIHIHSGKNRIVRRIFEHLDYDVLRLDRVAYAGLTKKGLERGEWRYLTEQEVIRLKFFVK